MQLDIFTPDRKVFSGEVKLVRVPGTKSPFEILHNHAPIISTLSPGKIKVVSSDGTKTFFEVMSDGVVEVKKNTIVILAEKLVPLKDE